MPWRCGQRRLQNKDKDAQVTKDNVPEFREDETPVEENCEKVAMLKDVQGNMVRSRVKAIECSIKSEQKELFKEKASVATSDKQDKPTDYWAQGYGFLGKEYPWKAVPEEGDPVGPGRQQQGQEAGQHHHGYKKDWSETGKGQDKLKLMPFYLGSRTTTLKEQSAGGPGELGGQHHAGLRDILGVGGSLRAGGVDREHSV